MRARKGWSSLIYYVYLVDTHSLEPAYKVRLFRGFYAVDGNQSQMSKGTVKEEYHMKSSTR